MSFSYFIGEYHHFRTSSICFCTCVCGGVVLNPCIVSVSFLLLFFFSVCFGISFMMETLLKCLVILGCLLHECLTGCSLGIGGICWVVYYPLG